MSIFKLPDLGEGLPDAEVREWHVKVGDEVEIVKLDKTIEHFGGEWVLAPVGTKAFVTCVDVTGEVVGIDEDEYSYHASDLVLVNGKKEMADAESSYETLRANPVPLSTPTAPTTP